MKKVEMKYLLADEVNKLIKDYFKLNNFDISDNIKQKENFKVFRVDNFTPVSESRFERFENEGVIPYITHTLLEKMVKDKALEKGYYLIDFSNVRKLPKGEKVEVFSIHSTDLDNIINSNIDFLNYSSLENEKATNLTSNVYFVKAKKNEDLSFGDKILHWQENEKILGKMLNIFAFDKVIEEGIYVVDFKWEEYTAEQISSIKSKISHKPYNQRKVFGHLR